MSSAPESRHRNGGQQDSEATAIASAVERNLVMTVGLESYLGRGGKGVAACARFSSPRIVSSADFANASAPNQSFLS